MFTTANLHFEDAAIANFFKPQSQKEPEKTTWRVIDRSLLVAKYDNKTIPTYSKPRKIAAFDLVGIPSLSHSLPN